MAQTPATRKALIRDRYFCIWCYYRQNRRRNIFNRVTGYVRAMGGGHHIFGRANVDEPETIIALCCECHTKVENAIISKCDVIDLTSWYLGIDLGKKYAQFHKCHAADPAPGDPASD